MQLRNLAGIDITGKNVLLRLDLNVPMKSGKVIDPTRIEAAIPTIRYLQERAGKLVICSHLGRPHDAPDPKYSLEPVGLKLAEILGSEVVFVADYMDQPLDQVFHRVRSPQVILLENLRFHPGESANDRDFAQRLARPFDFFVNDAFGTVHRAHASTVAIPELMAPERRAAGFLVEKEVLQLEKVLRNPQAPFVVAMGGGKVSDKLGVILSLLERCNHLLIGGAMAYTFLKQRGISIGKSKIEEDKLSLVETIYREAEKRRVEIHLPVDHVVAEEFAENSPARVTAGPEIPGSCLGLDIGPKTIDAYRAIVSEAQTAFWNGPMGVYEWEAFSKGTKSLALALASCRGFTLIGGGDCVAAVNLAGVADKIDHISTGGGASLEFLEGKILPGLGVLARSFTS